MLCSCLRVSFFCSSPNALLICLFLCLACSCLTLRPHKPEALITAFHLPGAVCGEDFPPAYQSSHVWCLCWLLSVQFPLSSQRRSLIRLPVEPGSVEVEDVPGLGGTAPPVALLSRLFGSSLGKPAVGTARCWDVGDAMVQRLTVDLLFSPTAIVFLVRSTNTGLQMLVEGHRGPAEEPVVVPAGVEVSALQTCKNPSHESRWFTPFFSGLRTVSEETGLVFSLALARWSQRTCEGSTCLWWSRLVTSDLQSPSPVVTAAGKR